MSVHSPVVIPAIPPRKPAINLIDSSIRPTDTSEQTGVLTPEQRAALPEDMRTELAAREGKAWTRGVTYAPENHSEAEVRDGVDGTTVDLPAMKAPLNVTAAGKTTGGSITAGEKEYVVTAVNANGQTTGSVPVNVTTTGTTSSVLIEWQKVANAASYKVYGRVKGSLGLIGSVGPFDGKQAAEFVDDGSKAPGATVPVSNTTGGPGSYTNLAVVTAIPYLVRVEDFCSTWGFAERDFKGRALRLLDNATPKAVEREFEKGTLAKAKGLPNNFLTKEGAVTNVTPGTVPSLTRGFQILQESLAECGFGGQGMIHVPLVALPNLLNVRRVGKMVYDIVDNIVVPGVGYQGTAPDGHAAASAGNIWIYATDLVQTRTEDQDATVLPDTFAEALDRGQNGEPNTLRFAAQQFAVAYWDGACQFGCEVVLPT